MAKALLLEINGRRLELKPESQEIIFPPGAGGLPTMKIGILYRALLPAESNGGQYLINYRDGNFAGRAGWKEIIATAKPGVDILNSSVAETDRSSQLSNYPTALMDSPPQELGASVVLHSRGHRAFGRARTANQPAPEQQADAAQVQSEGQYLSQLSTKSESMERIENGPDLPLPAGAEGTQAPGPDVAQPAERAAVNYTPTNSPRRKTGSPS